MALMGLGKHEAAIADFDRILAKDPRSIHGQFSRGIALYRLNRYTQALAAFATAEVLIPPKDRALLEHVKKMRALVLNDMRRQR